MAIAQIEIVARTTDADLDEFQWEVEAYLSGLRSNGQIERDWLLEYNGLAATIVCQIARPNALQRRHCSKFVRERLDSLRRRFQADPQWSVAVASPHQRVNWRNAEHLILQTDIFDTLYPLAVPGSPSRSIPTFTLPISERTREELRHWADEFQHLEWVWIDSGTLANRAYRELADPRSAFSATGRNLARQVQTELNKPVYYFLPKYYSRAIENRSRPCPGCGCDWKLKPEDCEPSDGLITYRCQHCRLCSSDPQHVDARLARIGEYRVA